MIRFYFHPTPNPAKVALFLEETGLPYEIVPVDTSKGEQHSPSFRAINPNGKVPAIVDTEGPGGAATRVFDSSAILLYLGHKTGQLIGAPDTRPELFSWMFFIASGLGPFSGQAVHFQFAAPEGLEYARNRYRREAERHYQVLEDHMAGRDYIVGDTYTIADISAWGWIDRASRAALALDPRLVLQARFPLAVALFELHQAQESRREFEAVRRQNGDDPNVDYYLGRLDLTEGKLDAAVLKCRAEPSPNRLSLTPRIILAVLI